MKATEDLKYFLSLFKQAWDKTHTYSTPSPVGQNHDMGSRNRKSLVCLSKVQLRPQHALETTFVLSVGRHLKFLPSSILANLVKKFYWIFFIYVGSRSGASFTFLRGGSAKLEPLKNEVDPQTWDNDLLTFTRL